MARASFNKCYLALIVAVAIPFTVSACYAVTVHTKASAQLQEVADNAALAGVNCLAASAEQPADARSVAAIAAAKTVITAQTGIVRSLQPSVDGLTMSVTLEDRDKGMQVSATARYIPAKDAQPQQAANGSGHSSAAL